MDVFDNNDPIAEVERLLNDLHSYAPLRNSEDLTRYITRSVDEGKTIDDSLDVEELPLETTPLDFEIRQDGDAPAASPVVSFSPLPVCPLAAVDCGIIRLGETENGLVIALRATLAIQDGENSRNILFRTGPIYLSNEHKLQILHQLGVHLGREDIFVEVDNSDPERIIPIAIKSGIADNAHQFGDRFRNWLERLVQKIAVHSIQNGIILLDGALTLRTRDTPSIFMENLVTDANRSGNAVVAISKQSSLLVGGKSIRFWLNDAEYQACFRELTPIMRHEGQLRVVGNVYAARFSPIGPTFRMDVNPAEGQADHEVINQLFNSALMRSGYPDILVRAHALSYFTPPDVLILQAQARAAFSLIPQVEVDLEGIFAPFGGRFK